MALVAILVAFPSGVGRAADRVAIQADLQHPPVRFAVEQLIATLTDLDHTVAVNPPAKPPAGTMRIRIAVDDARFRPQAYQVRRSADGSIDVTGGDVVGAMYGTLHLAEAVRIRGEARDVPDAEATPFVSRRGIKFNIPLDARTPSYDDTGDAAQQNIEVMWDFAFWRELLDDMARQRFNVLTLWSCHPYPSIVKLDKYPDVALDDVCVLTEPPTHKTHREWKDIDIQDPARLRVVRRMAIDKKIAHWRQVMQHAHDRGIEVYLFHWNVFVHAAAGKYGITDEQTNEHTIAYLRACVTKTLLTYPHLAGIGVTAGEHMHHRNDAYSKERWLWRTYGLGVMDAKAAQPGRRVRFIFRRHQSGLDNIVKAFEPYDDTFETSFKYARAHMYSSPATPFFDTDYRADVERNGVKCWQNVRNDDLFCFRWGDPDYVRAFIKQMPHDVMAGYYVGPDGFVLGREFISKAGGPRQLEARKHWWRFMLWGRMGYDPTLDREFWQLTLADRLPELDAARLYDAWTTASKIVPQVNTFHWRDWDFMWSVEGCLDRGQGFHSVEQFIDVPPMDRSGMLSIPDYVSATRAGRDPNAITPLDVAANLERWSNDALRLTASLRRDAPRLGAAARATLADIDAMSQLGLYYAAKIRGATSLARYRRTNKPVDQQQAVAHLTQAVTHWQSYTQTATSQYHPQLLARTRRLDWEALLPAVRKDVEIARGG